MNRYQRVCALLLALVLLTACAPRRTEPLPYPEPSASEPGKTIAYVPLDDRPDNVERVVYLAESLGYTLEMPELDLFRTRLDGQPLNENGTRHGDPQALAQWVLEQEEAGCDHYILSLDQLHSGGLVSSRSIPEDSAVLRDGEAAAAQLAELLEALAADSGNVVWLLDSVMRLAPTLGNVGNSVPVYNWVRAFGALPRVTLEGDALTLEGVLESYWRGPDGEDLYEKAADQQGAEFAEDRYGPYRVLCDSLEARERKLRLSDGIQGILAQPGYERFRLLVGIDDSSLEDCIQKNEIAYLRRGLRSGADGERIDWLLSGVDDLAFKAVTRMYLDETGWSGTAAVRYFGGSEEQSACVYDFQPLTEIVEEHLSFLRLTEDSGTDGLQILILTQPEDAERKSAYLDALLSALRDCRKNQRPTVLVNASNGTYGRAVYDALTKGAELGHLLSCAGLLDMAIVTGTALSHGAARYAVLQNGGGTVSMDRAWARTLADSVIKDFCYRSAVRDDLLAYVVNDLGGDPDNFWAPEVDREALLERLVDGMERQTPPVVKNLEKSRLITSLEPYEEQGWGGIALENYRYPWDRAFEIGMDIRLGEFR